MRHMRVKAVALVCTLLLSSCGVVEKVFVWKRNEGRNAWTEFEIRVRVDQSAKIVVWLEDAVGEKGPIGQHIEKYERCEIFDLENWHCTLVPGQNEVRMQHGKLHQAYWGEDRKFQTKRRLKKPSF